MQALSKETLLAAVQQMPDRITLDEVFERLIFIAKVEEGFAAIERGEFKTQAEVEQLVQS